MNLYKKNNNFDVFIRLLLRHFTWQIDSLTYIFMSFKSFFSSLSFFNWCPTVVAITFSKARVANLSRMFKVPVWSKLWIFRMVDKVFSWNIGRKLFKLPSLNTGLISLRLFDQKTPFDENNPFGNGRTSKIVLFLSKQWGELSTTLICSGLSTKIRLRNPEKGLLGDGPARAATCNDSYILRFCTNRNRIRIQKSDQYPPVEGIFLKTL